MSLPKNLKIIAFTLALIIGLESPLLALRSLSVRESTQTLNALEAGLEEEESPYASPDSETTAISQKIDIDTADRETVLSHVRHLMEAGLINPPSILGIFSIRRAERDEDVTPGRIRIEDVYAERVASTIEWLQKDYPYITRRVARRNLINVISLDGKVPGTLAQYQPDPRILNYFSFKQTAGEHVLHWAFVATTAAAIGVTVALGLGAAGVTIENLLPQAFQATQMASASIPGLEQDELNLYEPPNTAPIGIGQQLDINTTDIELIRSHLLLLFRAGKIHLPKAAGEHKGTVYPRSEDEYIDIIVDRIARNRRMIQVRWGRMVTKEDAERHIFTRYHSFLINGVNISFDPDPRLYNYFTFHQTRFDVGLRWMVLTTTAAAIGVVTALGIASLGVSPSDITPETLNAAQIASISTPGLEDDDSPYDSPLTTRVRPKRLDINTANEAELASHIQDLMDNGHISSPSLVFIDTYTSFNIPTDEVDAETLALAERRSAEAIARSIVKLRRSKPLTTHDREEPFHSEQLENMFLKNGTQVRVYHVPDRSIMDHFIFRRTRTEAVVRWAFITTAAAAIGVATAFGLAQLGANMDLIDPNLFKASQLANIGTPGLEETKEKPYAAPTSSTFFRGLNIQKASDDDVRAWVIDLAEKALIRVPAAETADSYADIIIEARRRAKEVDVREFRQHFKARILELDSGFNEDLFAYLYFGVPSWVVPVVGIALFMAFEFFRILFLSNLFILTTPTSTPVVIAHTKVLQDALSNAVRTTPVIHNTLGTTPLRESHTIVVGPSLHQSNPTAFANLMASLPRHWRVRIYLDTQDSEDRADWAARHYDETNLPTAIFYGTAEEFTHFTRFSEGVAGIQTTPASPAAEGILGLVLSILGQMGLHIGELEPDTRTQFEGALQILLSA